jgi:transposase-like protein
MTPTTPNESGAAVGSSIGPNIKVTMDTRGRLRASAEQRRAILAEFQRSGVCAAQFAKVTGLKYSTFAGWVQRYRRAKSKPAPKRLRLLEAVIDPSPCKERTSGNIVTVHLPGQVRVELSSLAQVPLVSELLKALQTGQAGC